MNEIAGIMWALWALAGLALLEFLGLRQPTRTGLVATGGFLRAKWVAFRVEVRTLVAWIFRPDPIPDEWPGEEPGPREWTELDISSPSTSSGSPDYTATTRPLGPNYGVCERCGGRHCVCSLSPGELCDPKLADEDGWCWHGKAVHAIEAPFRPMPKPAKRKRRTPAKGKQ